MHCKQLCFEQKVSCENIAQVLAAEGYKLLIELILSVYWDVRIVICCCLSYSYANYHFCHHSQSGGTLGSDAVLTCSHSGNPSPIVVWFKDGEVVRDGPKYSVSSVSNTVNTLTICNVQPAVLTSYQCHLSNKRGSNVGEIFICRQRKDMHVRYLIK